ncbi:MAG: hypothetical protein Q9214_007081, partial [Letrouitia sp. 1 TL-2023]
YLTKATNKQRPDNKKRMKLPTIILVLLISATVVTNSKAPPSPNETSPGARYGRQRHGAYPSLLYQDTVRNAGKHDGIDTNQEPYNISHIFDPFAGGRLMQRSTMGNGNHILSPSEIALAKSLKKMVEKGDKLAAAIMWADEATDEASAAIAEVEKAILEVIEELAKETNKTTAKW